jgi:hypothetical protein
MWRKALGQIFEVCGWALDWHAKKGFCVAFYGVFLIFCLRMEWVFEVWTLWLSASFHKNHDEESKLYLSYSFEKLVNYLMIHSRTYSSYYHHILKANPFSLGKRFGHPSLVESWDKIWIDLVFGFTSMNFALPFQVVRSFILSFWLFCIFKYAQTQLGSNSKLFVACVVFQAHSQ